MDGPDATVAHGAASFLARRDVPAPAIGDVQGSRLALRANTRMISGHPVVIPLVADITVDGVPCRFYGMTDEPRPVLIYLHGGGFVVGDLETVDPVCRRLARQTGWAVVSVDYRRAPEHPFPAAVEDSYRVVRAISEGSVAECSPTSIALAGDSAGGNLATVTARSAVDAGIQIACQLLVYPIVDHRRDERASRRQFAKGFGLDAELLDWYRSCYLPDSSQWTDPSATPLLARLHGQPPALILTAECDVLRDQAEEYAAELAAAGVPVVASRFLGELHGFLRAFDISPAAAAAVGTMAGMLEASTARPSP
jgi:acetyl esterase